MCAAGHAADKAGRAMSKGKPFDCVRGQGWLTLGECLTKFLGGHEVCSRDCRCSYGKVAVEKMNNGEIEMPKKFKKGDCGCGKKDVQLDSEGRCYQCRDKARWAAQKAAKEAADEAQKAARMTPAASKDDTPPVAPGEAAPSIQAAQGGHPAFDPHAKIDFSNGAAARELVEHHGRLLVAENATPEPADLSDDPDLSDGPDLPDAGYAPGVTAVVETLPPEGQLVGDEDPAPGDCQGWPETAGALVIEGMEFEAFAPRRKPGLKSFVSLQSGKTFNFSPGAVRQFDMLRYHHVELHYSRSGGAIAFILHEQKPDGANTLSLYAPKARDRARVGAQGFMRAFGLNLEGKGPWLVEQPQPGVLVARVG
jgi:hypothetical protein